MEAAQPESSAPARDAFRSVLLRCLPWPPLWTRLTRPLAAAAAVATAPLYLRGRDPNHFAYRALVIEQPAEMARIYVRVTMLNWAEEGVPRARCAGRGADSQVHSSHPCSALPSSVRPCGAGATTGQARLCKRCWCECSRVL